MFSIPRTHRLQRTTPRSLRGAIHKQYGGFSMDQGEKASFEYVSATCHLPGNLSASG